MTDLFALGARRLDWLATREATIARNVANADTPGFKPSDLKPFEDALAASGAPLARTNPLHMASTGAQGAPGSWRAGEARSWETSISGNAVSLEQELARAAETNRAAGVTSAALRAFQRMTLAVTKG